jgi:hypothetical protein
MPSTDIREIDNTAAEEATYDDYVVLVPGSITNASYTSPTLFSSLTAFKAAVCKKIGSSYQEPTGLGYKRAVELLNLGLKVLYAPYNSVASYTVYKSGTKYAATQIEDSYVLTPLTLTEYAALGSATQLLCTAILKTDSHSTAATVYSYDDFEDRAKYDIRFFLLGDALSEADVTDNDTTVSLVKLASQNAIKSAATRGDAIALVDIPEEKALTTTNILAWVNSFVVDDINRPADTYDNTITSENPFKYAACFAPWFKYKGQTDYIAGSMGYLSCFATYISKFPDWFAMAGAVRGVMPYSAVTTEALFGDAEVSQLQKRTCTEEENAAGGFKAVNPICEVRPYGNVVYGSRTLFPITINAETGTNGLTASSFLNIRNLCCDIKKTLYRASRRFRFDPNSDVLWINFKSAITPLLEKMKTGQGIRGYKIIKEKTAQKATLKARIRIIPIEPVEDFDLTVELNDSLLTVSEA